MEYIYVASEANHGDVCYSRTLSGIYAYLIKAKWITKDTEIYSHVQLQPALLKKDLENLNGQKRLKK